MTVKEACKAILAVMDDLKANRINIAVTKQPISAYGPVLAMRKSKTEGHAFDVLIEEGPEPENTYWTALVEVPDWKYVLADAYKAIVPKELRARYQQALVVRVVNL